MNQPHTRLYLIPTVLADDTQQQVLSPQILSTIQNLNVFFVENVRTARRFISSLKLGKVIDGLTFIELHKDTPEHVTMEHLRSLSEDAGVLSEAGCPGVADPGAVAVGIAHRLGIRVVPLVGPSSILLALMSSGLSGQSFAFHGYLPIDKSERKKALQQLERDARQSGQTQIFMETPFRNNAFLDAILETCATDTMLCIAANVTAEDEFIKTMSVKNWKANKPDLHKKPTIFLIG
ncbi:SAM-dependent methyltransferase [Dyadobacter psychrophilus]|uniref:16S rRNA (Cytidine1402-2'-O)-methyltransferase n=1 Tax=Dyadobacter psychrophilus TaxID=651661 RepID=A0A1T5C308_9BACT|nr:SAM-dependent methyltransferase [Dyadobacter psychrophilus]SKB53791.1 16S rRNA (cytidine1402-2'-O)-methyltransferase [Dyadobacter psychrophilus]